MAQTLNLVMYNGISLYTNRKLNKSRPCKQIKLNNSKHAKNEDICRALGTVDFHTSKHAKNEVLKQTKSSTNFNRQSDT